MNINRIIILWIMFYSGVYAFGYVPLWSYWLAVAPAILYHALWNSRKWEERTAPSEHEVPSPEMVIEEEYPPLGADEIVMDEEFEERIELDCGGYVELEGWRERVVSTEQLQGPVKTKLAYQNQNEGYERLRVEK